MLADLVRHVLAIDLVEGIAQIQIGKVIIAGGEVFVNGPFNEAEDGFNAALSLNAKLGGEKTLPIETNGKNRLHGKAVKEFTDAKGSNPTVLLLKGY